MAVCSVIFSCNTEDERGKCGCTVYLWSSGTLRAARARMPVKRSPRLHDPGLFEPVRLFRPIVPTLRSASYSVMEVKDQAPAGLAQSRGLALHSTGLRIHPAHVFPQSGTWVLVCI